MILMKVTLALYNATWLNPVLRMCGEVDGNMSRPPAWFSRVPAIVVTLAVFTVIGFSIGCGGAKEPVIISIRPSGLVLPDGEVEIRGENLDLISEVRLRRGSSPWFPVPMFPPAKSLLTFTIPGELRPGKYEVEFTWDGGTIPASRPVEVGVKQTFLMPTSTPLPTIPTATSTPEPPATTPTQTATRTLTATPAATVSSVPEAPKEPIVFAGLTWDSASLQNAIAMYIIKNGYGYPSISITGKASTLWENLTNGEVHVFMEVWLPNQEKEWTDAIGVGSIIPLGKSLDENWQSAFVVPTYVIKGDPSREIEPLAPDLIKPEDIRKYQDLFARPESGGKAVLVSCLKT